MIAHGEEVADSMENCVGVVAAVVGRELQVSCFHHVDDRRDGVEDEDDGGSVGPDRWDRNSVVGLHDGRVEDGESGAVGMCVGASS